MIRNLQFCEAKNRYITILLQIKKTPIKHANCSGRGSINRSNGPHFNNGPLKVVSGTENVRLFGRKKDK